MGSLLAIDYGHRRVGIASTDPMKLIASPLKVVAQEKIFDWLREYLNNTLIEAIAVGYPLPLQGPPSLITVATRCFIRKLQRCFPHIPIFAEDERFTSVIAEASSLTIGLRKKGRRKDRANLDKISATIILQSFMERYRAGHCFKCFS